MQRRIGLAQALINDPDLVILDEPTAGLDPIGCREVKDLIVALARRGKTVILSSHLLSDVEDVCDRVVIYYGGKIQAPARLKELLATPDTLRITTPVLPRETLERVLEIIRKDAITGEVRVDNPTQNLESYFLDVVRKRARRTKPAARNPARAWPNICAAAWKPNRTGKVLEKLSCPTGAARGRRQTGHRARGRPKVDDKKLAALAQAQPRRHRSSRASETPKPVDLSKADEKFRRCWERKNEFPRRSAPRIETGLSENRLCSSDVHRRL
jgi:ABC-type glutathione transport system ATPase component